ncbi:RNA pseudouridine synthase [Spirochaetia bacterium]|nr:RNA pseudouridine synthase [Spirochaetia bacterium]
MKNVQPYTVIFEDERIIAVNKASGISVGGDRWDDSLQRLDRLIAAAIHTPGADHGYAKIFTVHRIDQDTSGLVVFAKDGDTHRLLSQAFEERQVRKRYIAIVHGRPPWSETSCDLALVPNGNKQHLTIIDKFRGKKSLTCFRLLGSAGNYSILEALPQTGRTHQIRVHAASLGFPIACDPLYGKDSRPGRTPPPVLLSSFKRNWRGDPLDEKPLLARLGLHAAELSLPTLGASIGGSAACAVDTENAAPGELRLSAPLPRDMAALIKQMEKQADFSSGVLE